MSFAIYNKTNRQLYVDWKNSSLILNDQKLEYWIDMTHTSTTMTSKSRSVRTYSAQPDAFNWSYVIGSMTSTQGTAVSEGSMVRDERITSIPPHAYIGLAKYELMNHILELDTARSEKFKEVRNDHSIDHPNSTTVVTRQRYLPNESPLRFRNYLMVSFSEDMKEPFQTDNAFWLSDVCDMDYRHFHGKRIGVDTRNYPIYAKPYKKRSAFYQRYGYYR